MQLYANAIRKLPLMRSPWEHVIAIGLVGDRNYHYLLECCLLGETLKHVEMLLLLLLVLDLTLWEAAMAVCREHADNSAVAVGRVCRQVAGGVRGDDPKGAGRDPCKAGRGASAWASALARSMPVLQLECQTSDADT